MVRKMDLVEFQCVPGVSLRLGDNGLTTWPAARSIPFRLIALSGWINQDQLLIIDYLREENRVLREQLDGRPKFNDDQRRRLAAKAKGAEASVGGGHYRHSRDVAGLASQTYCPEIRRQRQALTGSASHGRRGRSVGASNGERESGLGLSTHRQRVIQSGTRTCQQHNR